MNEPDFAFYPVETYHNEAGKLIVTGPCPLDGKTDATNIRKKVGALVEITGEVYRITSVDTFARLTPPSLGEPVCLCVDHQPVLCQERP